MKAIDPRGCRPFDRDRCGLSPGEAGAAIVLVRERTRAPSGDHIRGWGSSNDANHMTGPSRDGSGLALAIRAALRSAGLQPEEIDYVNAHGTGTPYNDAMESQPRFTTCSATACPPFSGLKGMFGHTLGAAGVVETIACVLAMQERVAARHAPAEARRGRRSGEPRPRAALRGAAQSCFETQHWFRRRERRARSRSWMTCCRHRGQPGDGAGRATRRGWAHGWPDGSAEPAGAAGRGITGSSTLTPCRATASASVWPLARDRLSTDVEYWKGRGAGGGPSPTLFAYTLPSAAIGEIAIRHRLTGPNLCFVGEDANVLSEAAAIDSLEARRTDAYVCRATSLRRRQLS